MRLVPLAFAALALVAPTAAQYFSAGWTPGQAVPTVTPDSSSFDPKSASLPQPRQDESRFSLSYLFSTGPAAQLFNRLGINVTERLEAAKNYSEIWDGRVPLITDANYNDLIVNEVLTEEEEKSRVWLLIV